MTNKTQHIRCPCGKSSDAFSIQENGWGRCFSGACTEKKNWSPASLQKKGFIVLDTPQPESKGPVANRAILTVSPLSTVPRAFQERCLAKETIARYKVDVGVGDAKHQAKYPLFSPESGEHLGNKVRYPDKQFSLEGEKGFLNKAGLFGRHAFPAGSAKAITVVEGQDDAMAAYQMMGSRYPVVSVHSSSTAADDVKRDFEYLNSFETIVICMDADDAGRMAANKIANLPFPIGKLKVLNLREYNDPNQYLIEKCADKFTKEWWQAPERRPDGIKLGKDMLPEILDRSHSFSVPYPFEGLNKKTYGLRLSELTLITAETGIGKTSLFKHFEHALLTNDEIKEKNYGIGFLHLEETNRDTALGLISIHNSVPYHLPDAAWVEDDIKRGFDDIINNDRVVIWDHFGSNSVDEVVNKVRHMSVMGCKYIFIDHLSIIVSDQNGDERKQLDEISTKLKTITMELELSICAIIHTNRKGEIRGSAGPEKVANTIIRIERDKLDPDEWRRNVTKLVVEKNRPYGFTGPACWLWYNPETGRMMELDDDEAKRYEDGLDAGIGEQW